MAEIRNKLRTDAITAIEEVTVNTVVSVEEGSESGVFTIKMNGKPDIRVAALIDFGPIYSIHFDGKHGFLSYYEGDNNRQNIAWQGVLKKLFTSESVKQQRGGKKKKTSKKAKEVSKKAKKVSKKAKKVSKKAKG